MKKIVVAILVFLISVSISAQNVKEFSREWTSASQVINVETDSIKKFKVFAYAKVETVDKDAWSGIWARVDNKPNQGRGFFDNMGDRPITSNEWKAYEVEGVINSQSDKINFGVICSYNGKFFFDKFEVYLEDDNGEFKLQEIKNSSFEESITNSIVPGWSQGISKGDVYKVKEFDLVSSNDVVDGNYSLLVEGKGIKKNTGSAKESFPNAGIYISILFFLVLVFSLMTKLFESQDGKWTKLGKIGFRFSFIYFLLIVVFQNNGAFPFFELIAKYPIQLMQKLALWFGENVVGIPYVINAGPNGSGDTTFDYLIVLIVFLIALFGTLIWSVIDNKRNNYNTLYYWLTTAVRFYVGLMLINYGLIKIIQLQFSAPGFYRLLQNYGDSSPMGLAWTFLGFSEGYNMFMGIAEVLAGLLLFRRTLTFGAVITLMTTMNVMAVNYFYDIPVKILSTHLVIMTLFLLSRDIKKVMLYLVTNIQVEKLTPIKRPKLNKGINIGLNVLKGLIVAYVLGYGFYNCLERKSQRLAAQNPQLYGLYEVNNFVINGDTITNYKSDKLWKNIRFEREGAVQVEKMNKKRDYYRIEIDSVSQKIKFYTSRSGSDYFDFNYSTNDDTLDFNFIHKNDTISGQTKRLDKSDFSLTNRGFNWISEYPFNR